MKLLAFTETYARGGGNRYLVDLVNGMAPEFDEIVLASNPGGLFPEDTARLTTAAEIMSIKVLTSSRFQLRGGLPALLGRVISVADPVVMRLNVARFGRVLRSVRPDVLLVVNGGFPAARSALAAVIAGGRFGIPVGLAVVGTPIGRRARVPGRYEAAVDRAVWNASSAVVVSGSAILQRLESLRGLPSGCGRVLPNALPDRGPQHVARGDELLVGSVSRMDRSKGMIELAEAFTVIAHDFPQVQMRLVGEGDAREEVRGILDAAGLVNRVALPGFVSGDDAIAKEVAALDVYVLPSHGEGGGPPYSILEAMRAETAIVTTSVGSISDGMTDGAEGLLVPPLDSDALAGALTRLLDDAALRERLGHAARERFLRDFTLPSMHERAAQFARDLIATPVSRSFGTI